MLAVSFDGPWEPYIRKIVDGAAGFDPLSGLRHPGVDLIEAQPLAEQTAGAVIPTQR